MKRSRILFPTLGIVQVFVSLTALGAGIGLIRDPSGISNGFGLELLSSSPFQDFLIPGMVLFIINGLGSLFGGILSLRRSSQAGFAGVILGMLLLGWLLFQIYWIGLFPLLHSLYILLAFVEIYFGYAIMMKNRRLNSLL